MEGWEGVVVVGWWVGGCGNEHVGVYGEVLLGVGVLGNVDA